MASELSHDIDRVTASESSKVRSSAPNDLCATPLAEAHSQVDSQLYRTCHGGTYAQGMKEKGGQCVPVTCVEPRCVYINHKGEVEQTPGFCTSRVLDLSFQELVLLCKAVV